MANDGAETRETRQRFPVVFSSDLLDVSDSHLFYDDNAMPFNLRESWLECLSDSNDRKLLLPLLSQHNRDTFSNPRESLDA